MKNIILIFISALLLISCNSTKKLVDHDEDGMGGEIIEEIKVEVMDEEVLEEEVMDEDPTEQFDQSPPTMNSPVMSSDAVISVQEFVIFVKQPPGSSSAFKRFTAMGSSVNVTVQGKPQINITTIDSPPRNYKVEEKQIEGQMGLLYIGGDAPHNPR